MSNPDPDSRSPRLKLPAITQWTYGLGEMGVVAPISVSIFFLLFFLTQVVGLPPAQAGSILLLGRLWDAINDPLIGSLSDATPALPRWGRRYPWLIASILPLSLTCALQWWVPPLHQTWPLLTYYGCLSILSYSFFTTVQIPFTALAAELAQTYDDRTRLMGFKSAFNLLGSIAGLLLAQAIFSQIQDPKQRYLALGIVLGIGVLVGMAIAICGTLPHYHHIQQQQKVTKQKLLARSQSSTPSPHSPLKTLFQNRPFRWLIGLYLCSWVGIQTTAAILPYFVTSWMGLAEQQFIQMALLVQISSILAMPFWSWLAQRTNKRRVYLVGAPIAVLGLLGLFTVQPGQIDWMYGWGLVVGIGLATFYLVPLAMLPDVIDLDAFEDHQRRSPGGGSGQRREGLLTSIMVFLQKLALAIALFLTSTLLDWSGLATAPAITQNTASSLGQPESALWAIRWMIGPLPALIIVLGWVCAWCYPLTREQHRAITMTKSSSPHP